MYAERKADIVEINRPAGEYQAKTREASNTQSGSFVHIDFLLAREITQVVDKWQW